MANNAEDENEDTKNQQKQSGGKNITGELIKDQSYKPSRLEFFTAHALSGLMCIQNAWNQPESVAEKAILAAKKAIETIDKQTASES